MAVDRSDWSVGIIGAGMVGCAAAFFLAERGARVVVFDEVGIGRGASGRNAGAIEHPYDAAQEELYTRTVELLHQHLGAAMPAAPTGMLLLTPDPDAARDLAARYGEFSGLSPQVIEADQLRAAEPLLAEGLAACRVETGYPVAPRAATAHFAQRASERHARFELGRPATLTRGPDGAVDGIQVGAERQAFDAILIAAGARSGDVIDLGVEGAVLGLWGVSVTVVLPARPTHLLLEAEIGSIMAGGAPQDSVFTLIPNGEHVALGSTFLRREPVPRDWVATLTERAARFLPSIRNAEVTGALACARPRTFDSRPLLGRVPGESRLWLAAGHGGRGISTGAASGEMIAQAIAEGHDGCIPGPLRAARLARL